MPFLAPLIPALISGAASAVAGAGVNAITKGLSGGSAANPNLQTPTTAAQTEQAYGQSQQALQQQQALANQLSAQGGIQNQSQVYNQGQALASQLGDMAQGGGPNPALAQLAQTTGQNAANQAALMAGQRGASQNAGLIARQAGQQGASIQQQATGQAATMRAQQQLAAISALQQQQGMLGQLAGTQVGQQAQAVGNLNQLAQGEQGQLLGSIQGQNSAQLGQAQQSNQANQYQQGLGSQMASGIAGGLSAGVQSLVNPTKTTASGNPINAAGVPIQGPLKPGGGFAEGGQVGMPAIMKENYKGKSKTGKLLMSQGGKVPAMVSPGEIYLNPEEAKMVAEGKMSPMQGERIPGKAKVKGDSQKNDTVAKELDVGGVVVKRSKAQDEESARKFVEAVKSRKGKK